MKNSYKIVLICLAVLGVVYACKGPEKMTKDVKSDPVEIVTFPASMEEGHYVQIKRKSELKQVPCSEIGQAIDKFPCYKDCVTIEVRTNFPAILSASLSKSGGDEDMLKETNLYWENGVNTIQGDTGNWEELKLYLEAWNVELWKSTSTVGTDKLGEITIDVRPSKGKQ